MILAAPSLVVMILIAAITCLLMRLATLSTNAVIILVIVLTIVLVLILNGYLL